MSTAPATMSKTPASFAHVTTSPRKITAIINTNITLNLSMDATALTGPCLIAKK